MTPSARARSLFSTLVLAASVALAGCGGGSSSNTPPPTPAPAPTPTPPPAPTPPPTPTPPPAPASYTIGGSVSGLASGAWVVLLNNNGNNLTVLQNGNFTFSQALASGATYAVTIGQQPVGQTCTVTQGSDSVVNNNVTNVQVACVNNAPPRFAVGGTVTGLASGQSVTLQNNGGDSLTQSANGDFTFATAVASGASYAVTISTQPAGQTCTVANGTGTVGNSNVTTVAVNCMNMGETVLYSFAGGTDGFNPMAGLLRDASGNLYGTTYSGGANNQGTVFKITPAGVESILHSFADGANPYASLMLDVSGNLYGTTISGGANSQGTVFKITPAGVESVVYSFAGGTDGANPQASLVLDANGNLYGTTTNGGANNQGTVFKITPAGVESVVYSFAGGADGANPAASLVLDASGNLYGTTYGGGASGNGTVFKITPAGAESVVYSFAGGTDGFSPLAGLVRDASGNLYGTTYGGGAGNQGTVFKITPAGAESVVYSFAGGTDGARPQAGLVLDISGNLYGTTTYGGGASNQGTVFKITPAGVESVLWSFGSGTDGANPYAGLVRDASGNLYGTTANGGASGNGTVFKIVP